MIWVTFSTYSKSCFLSLQSSVLVLCLLIFVVVVKCKKEYDRGILIFPFLRSPSMTKHCMNGIFLISQSPPLSLWEGGEAVNRSEQWACLHSLLLVSPQLHLFPWPQGQLWVIAVCRCRPGLGNQTPLETGLESFIQFQPSVWKPLKDRFWVS